jgi:multiple sugar transport system ATP-binding protein
MRGELTRLHDRLAATVVYVTHDQVEAMTMGDRICIMHQGKVVQIGAPLDVYLRPANTFVATFLGAPPMNLIPATLDAARANVMIGESALALSGPLRDTARRAASESVLLGVRPEAIQPGGQPDRLDAQVMQIEPLGAETILRLKVRGVAREVLARVPGITACVVGEALPIGFDAASAHLFDPTTSLRL